MIWPYWLITYSDSEIRNSDNDNSGDIGREDIYKDNREELMLASLSDSYSELEVISVSVSGPFSYPTLYCLLTTFTTNYCLKEDVNYFNLRRSFYSK